MSIWQFHFQLIPIREEYFSPSILSDCNSTEILSKEFPREKSWSENWCLFGNIDETCVKIYRKNSVIEDISVRIDMRSITKSQLSCIIEFATVNQLQMLY